MKPQFKFTIAFSVLVFALLHLASCSKEESKTATESTTYTTSDLAGTWTGNLKVVFHGGDNDGIEMNLTQSFYLNSSGGLDSIAGHPPFTSNTGKLSVDSKGVITGVITTTHNTNPGIETTTENWSGCSLLSKTTMKVNMRWDWTNTGPGVGYYLVSGELGKK